MNRTVCTGSFLVVFWSLAAAVSAGGLESMGNTDGVLTWRIGTIPPGGSGREVVLFAFDASHEKLAKRLEAARRQFAKLPEPPQARAGQAAPPIAWIKNGTTDFALAGPGHFFWEGGRQGLTGPKGGQLSRFGYYVHYHDGAAVTVHSPKGRPEKGDKSNLPRSGREGASQDGRASHDRSPQRFLDSS